MTAVAAIIIAATAACSPSEAPSGPEQTSSVALPKVDRRAASTVKASLNEQTGDVELPMTKYWYSNRENVLVNAAVAYLLEDCVREAGFTMLPWGGDKTAIQDMRYGQWSRTLAAKNGVAPEEIKIQGVREKPPGSITPADDSAYSKCSAKIGRAGFPELLPGLAGDTSVQGSIEQTAAALTEQDDEFKKFRKDWEACIKNNGLTLPKSTSWVPRSTDSAEDQIRVGLTVVECKTEAGGVQKPYDIAAQYQASLMKGRQAELNTLAEQKATAVERAKEVLRNHGVADGKL